MALWVLLADKLRPSVRYPRNTMYQAQIRRVLANILLGLFVASTTTGFFLLETWAGFVAGGVTSGIAALLLGTESEENA